MYISTRLKYQIFIICTILCIEVILVLIIIFLFHLQDENNKVLKLSSEERPEKKIAENKKGRFLKTVTIYFALLHNLLKSFYFNIFYVIVCFEFKF